MGTNLPMAWGGNLIKKGAQGVARDVKKGSQSEQAAGDIYSRISDMFEGGYFGEESLERRLGLVQPSLDEARQRLGSVYGTQSAALSEHAGDALARQGVAPGHDRTGAFVGQMAPLQGQFLEALNRLDIGEAEMIMRLLQTGDTSLMQALQLLLGSAGGMKGTTETGDWLGVFQTLANVGGTAARVAGGGK